MAIRETTTTHLSIVARVRGRRLQPQRQATSPHSAAQGRNSACYCCCCTIRHHIAAACRLTVKREFGRRLPVSRARSAVAGEFGGVRASGLGSRGLHDREELLQDVLALELGGERDCALFGFLVPLLFL